MIKIQFSGQNIEITPALKIFVEEKSAKLQHHFNQISSMTVTLLVEKDQQTAEGAITYNAFSFHAKSVSTDMYHSIDEMINKLDSQLLKQKGKMEHHQK